MAEASEEGLGSQWAVMPMMMMIYCITSLHLNKIKVFENFKFHVL
jgi:hypothetical protein